MAGLHGFSVKVIESLTDLGGQLHALYLEKPIYDVAGFYGITGKDLTRILIDQANHFSAEFVTGNSVDGLQLIPDSSEPHIYAVSTQRDIHYARAILLTVGIGAFSPRKLTALGAENFENRGIYYVVPPLERFRDRGVLVVGGGDTALDWALAAVTTPVG